MRKHSKPHSIMRHVKAHAVRAHRRALRTHPIVKYGISLSIAELFGETIAEFTLHTTKELLTVLGILAKHS